MPQQMIAMAMQPRRKTKSGIFADQAGNTSVISIYGDLTGPMLEEFNVMTKDAVDCGMNLVLNLSQTHYIGPDALGSLISTAAEIRAARCQLWLAEMRPHLQRVIHGARLAGLFMTTSSVGDALHRTARAEQRIFHNSRTVQSLGHGAEDPVQVRVELLQDVCRKVTAANTRTPFDSPDSDSDFAFHSSMG